MKATRNLLLALILPTLIYSSAWAQYRQANALTSSGSISFPAAKPFTPTKSLLPGLRPDAPAQYKPSGLVQMPANIHLPQSDTYWLGSVTTQSYNGGKIGRFYYWDLQGNLRDSSLFFDIGGKGRRGLKLVFPRQRFRF